jgi:hypothetical protein
MVNGGTGRMRGGTMSLPSLFQLTDGFTDDCLTAVAKRIIGPSHPGAIESWDLALHGEGFAALTNDPFSFAGDFSFQGLTKLRLDLLGAAGFVFPPQWSCNVERTEYYATIRWMTLTLREYG